MPGLPPRPAPARPRRAGAWAALACLCALALGAGPRVRAHAGEGLREEQVADSPYPAEFRARVQAAIERGVRWLREAQLADGSWPAVFGGAYRSGHTALGALTLLKCGVRADDPAIQRAFAWLARQDVDRTYDAGVLLMALAARYAPAVETFATEETERYGSSSRPKDPCATSISEQDEAWMKRLVDWLLAQQNADGVWRYPGPEDAPSDLSNTQYALLGLEAADRCGTVVPPKAWLAALTWLLDKQEVFGRPCLYRGNEVRGRYRFQWEEPALARGFRYVPGEAQPRPTGSMTTAGLAGLIICQSRLWGTRRFTGEVRKRTREGIRDAMAWLQQHYDVESNPVQPPQPGEAGAGEQGEDGARRGRWRDRDPWYAYYMYGLERSGILGRFRFLGERDWYLDGAEALMGQQAPQGAFGHAVDTCFALLFLKRATSRHAAPVITPSDPPPPAERAPAATPAVPAPAPPTAPRAPGR